MKLIGVPITKTLRTQRRRLKNLSVLLLANVFTAGLGFVTTVTIANTLGAERFGQLAYALAIGGILAVNIRFGMDRSLIRDLSHYPERFNETLAASLLARGFLLALCICVLLLSMAVLPFDTHGISGGMVLVILATALNPLQIANVFDFWEIQGRHALYLCVEKALYFAMIWAVVFWSPDRLGLLWIGASLLTATLFFIGLQYRYAWGRLRPTLRAIPLGEVTRTALKLLAGNKWLWLAGVAALGMTALNQVVLKQFAGFSDLGVFAASFQLAYVAELLVRNIARIGRPILARRTIPGARVRDTARFLTLYLAVVALAVGLVAVPAIATPKIILQVFFAAEYADGFWVLRIFGIYFLFRIIDAVLGQYLIMVRMDRAFFTRAMASGLAALACSLVLIPHFAAVGAAVAQLVGEIILATFSIVATLMHLKRLAKPQQEMNSLEVTQAKPVAVAE
ncbi:oligosaccharide flippase family protein [Allochromatium vinosum]|uniref:oligosaccharide flippase family protein n=1 Tax=Allochromatium vinosum TaxID=1049 RepID=UPI0019047494|nr:oligosaccharide flippase family protein [Allochromatium vinosum]MBK1654988.1 hypothetical protein [Allochromatium vinosum]